MEIREIMTPNVRLATPDQTVHEAAKMMAEIDCGVLPVGEGDRLVGMITDRDIALRVVAAGKSPDKCKVQDIMSSGIKYVYEDETIEDVDRNMSTHQIRRFPVVDRNKRLVGIVSLGDLATRGHGPAAGHAIREVSRSQGAARQ
jgi:CBS domain-containing protein